MSLDISCADKLAATRSMAQTMGIGAALEEQLDYLAGYGGGAGRCVLMNDWAPASFKFMMHDRTGKPWFQGLLAYHGPLPDGTPNQTLAVDLSGCSAPHWSIYT